ncbi:hypothetical protein DFH11DRAFT_1747926 [Phellopilus nigrolimitatus]|nr:hypothetical protein DFH11DRAFT_1747926 [Phellopilus nigrolimitatus]
MAQRTTIQHILSGNMRKAYLCFDFLLDLSKCDVKLRISRFILGLRSAPAGSFNLSRKIEIHRCLDLWCGLAAQYHRPCAELHEYRSQRKLDKQRRITRGFNARKFLSSCWLTGCFNRRTARWPIPYTSETRQATLHNSRSQLKEVPFVLLLDGPFQPVKLLELESRRLPARDFDARQHRKDSDSSRFVLGYQALAMRKVSSIEHIDTYRNSNQLDELVQKVPNYLPTSTLSLVYHLLIPKLIFCSVILLDGEIAGDGKMARTLQMLRFAPLLRQSKFPRWSKLP